MKTTYECIKTYVKNQVWDEGLGQNVQYKEPHSYADDSRPPTDFEKAGVEIDRLTKELMADNPSTTYRAALSEVLSANPDLKAAYGGTK